MRVLYDQGMNAYVQARWCSMYKALVAAQGNGTAPCIGQLVGWRIARKHVKQCLLFNMWCAEDARLWPLSLHRAAPCLCTGQLPGSRGEHQCMWSRAIRQAAVLLPVVCGYAMQPVVVVSMVGVVLWVVVVVVVVAASVGRVSHRCLCGVVLL